MSGCVLLDKVQDIHPDGSTRLTKRITCPHLCAKQPLEMVY